MNKFYPPLAQAVIGLDNNTSEARHALYERARAMLHGAFMIPDRPVPEEFIERERQALEQAIRRIESEAIWLQADVAHADANSTERLPDERTSEAGNALPTEQTAAPSAHAENRKVLPVNEAAPLIHAVNSLGGAGRSILERARSLLLSPFERQGHTEAATSAQSGEADASQDDASPPALFATEENADQPNANLSATDDRDAALIQPRLQAMIQAARYQGIELDPNEFRKTASERAPSAAALSLVGTECRHVVARGAHSLASIASAQR